jgi:Leucine Rich repeat
MCAGLPSWVIFYVVVCLFVFSLSVCLTALQGNRYLTTLDLRNNPMISDEGGSALASVISHDINSTLECFDFRGTSVGEATLQAFELQVNDEVALCDVIVDARLKEVAPVAYASLQQKVVCSCVSVSVSVCVGVCLRVRLLVYVI